MKLSDNQIKFLINLAPDLSVSSRWNTKSALIKKLRDIDYFLSEFLEYPESKLFTKYLLKIKKRLKKV